LAARKDEALDQNLYQHLYQNCLSLCGDLIGQKSYSGEEMGAANALAGFFRARGLGEVTIDRLGNVIILLRGNQPGKTILFDGHLDTVPVVDADQWTHPPFSATLEGEKLFGRGTSDMKCALACMAAAAADYYEQTRGHFYGTIAIAGVVHEECFEGVAAREISARVKPDLVVIGEASECNLKIGQRGRAEIVLETFGKSAHSASPQKGVNAVYHMTELVRRVRELVPPQSNVLGPGILELTDIKSAPYPGASVVPNYCRATYDRRLLVGETKASVLAPIQAVIDSAAKEIPNLSAKVSLARGEERCYTGETISGERFFPGWAFPEGEDVVQQALEGLRARGVNASVTHYNFCTNGSHYAGEVGIPTIGFGPSSETLAHTRDEWVALEQIQAALNGYLGLLGQFCPAQ
jgi:putative selenium metabolism hydrolase